MWDVKNHTPFSSQGYFVRDHNGIEHWVVAVRATFDIRSGSLPRISQKQPVVNLVAQMQPNAPDEMYEDADFQPFRPTSDVVLHGTATLPEGQSAPAIPVTLRLGKASKTLICSGPRRLTRRRFSAEITEPELISELPLSWKFAVGGMCQKSEIVNDNNPVGSGWLSQWSDLQPGEDISLPQITAPQDLFVLDQPFPTPQGFGPIQPHWKARRQYAGTFDEAWQNTRHPRLPKDFDAKFYNSVLPDQCAALVGGEPIEVINVRSAGPLQFRLPQMIMTAHTRIGRDRIDSRLRIVGIMIDCASQTLAMIWNCAVACNGRDTEVLGADLRISQMSGVTS